MGYRDFRLNWLSKIIYMQEKKHLASMPLMRCNAQVSY